MLVAAWHAALWPNPYVPASYVTLWPAGAPGAAGDLPEDRPRLEVFPPPPGKANGTAVIICPGGGYRTLALTHEGRDIARWLNSLGVTAFVLEYRLSPRYHYPAALEDTQRAIRWLRFHRATYGLAPDRIGIIGFSAGGHLAALAAAMPEKPGPARDAIDAASSRTDFVLLGYPLLSLVPPVPYEAAIAGLLGAADSPDLRRALSPENLVKPGLPPFFIFHTRPDKVVPAETSERFYQALHKAGVPAELWLFDDGAHGVGLADGRDGAPYLPVTSLWAFDAHKWLFNLGLLAAPSEQH